MILRRSMWALTAIAALLMALTTTALVHSLQDRAEIRELVAKVLPQNAPPSVLMRDALRYIERNVPNVYPDEYYLLRAFKPTALQVLHGGGDCAYRARALIVMLDLHGVEASKRAVYDASGRPVHAVVEVQTERGSYVVDPLYHIVHEYEDGGPIPRQALRGRATLAASIGHAVEQGNENASTYPIDRYALADTSTINWQKSWIWRATFTVLTTVLSKEDAREVPRPYLSEEPQLMVAFISFVGAVFAILLALTFYVINHRR
jgi:hypothetical protein